MLSFIFLDKFLVKILSPINNTLSMKFVIEVVGGDLCVGDIDWSATLHK